jgi:hypothetical protein
MEVVTTIHGSNLPICMYVWMYVLLAKSKSPLKREKCFPKKQNTHKQKTETHRHHYHHHHHTHTHNLKENKQCPIIDLQPSLLLLLLIQS